MVRRNALGPHFRLWHTFPVGGAAHDRSTPEADLSPLLPRSALSTEGGNPHRPFQAGLRFSAKALGPSMVSSLAAMATKAG